MSIELSARTTAWWVTMTSRLRDERGISQTTEFLMILAAVVVIAGVVTAFATGFVNSLIANVGAP